MAKMTNHHYLTAQLIIWIWLKMLKTGKTGEPKGFLRRKLR